VASVQGATDIWSLPEVASYPHEVGAEGAIGKWVLVNPDTLVRVSGSGRETYRAHLEEGEWVFSPDDPTPTPFSEWWGEVHSLPYSKRPSPTSTAAYLFGRKDFRGQSKLMLAHWEAVPRVLSEFDRVIREILGNPYLRDLITQSETTLVSLCKRLIDPDPVRV